MASETTMSNLSQSSRPAKHRLPSVAEARVVMLAVPKVLETQSVALDDAIGRALAAPVFASRDQPPFAVSAMDGYAVRSADTPGPLCVGGESAAGHGFEGQCQPGMAIRISTGAAVPEGADTVVIQEDVQRDGDHVKVPASKAGENVRPR